MRILVAEHDLALGAFLEREFQAENHSVDLVAETGRAKPWTREREYDAAILDLHLSRQTGLDLLRDTRAAREEFPILILTSRVQSEDRCAVRP
jgi:two-component system, OmpR family, response regulator